MKTEQPILITSITAQATLSKNLLVSFAGDVPSAGDPVFGVVNADTNTNEQAPVLCIGIALVYSGAAISQGAALEVNGTAKVITKTTGTLIAYALDAASGADELIRVLLT